jgi:hypothetical protein
MEAFGPTRTVYHKETKVKRVFTEIQWQELGVSGQKDWTTKAPAEAVESEEQEAPAETQDQMIQRLITEGVAKGLADAGGLKPTATAMTMQANPNAAPSVDANTPVHPVGEGNVSLGPDQTEAEANAALKKVAADDTKKDGEGEGEKDANPELTAARKRYKELYPGQEAGRKQLKTLQDAIALAEEGK